MIIYNKYLDISTEDVDKEVDIFKLKGWLLNIEENIMTLGITLQRTEKIQDLTWLNKIKTARKFQIILKGQIQNRINFLSSKKSYSQVLVELLKEKVTSEEFTKIEQKAKSIINDSTDI